MRKDAYYLDLGGETVSNSLPNIIVYKNKNVVSYPNIKYSNGQIYLNFVINDLNKNINIKIFDETSSNIEHILVNNNIKYLLKLREDFNIIIQSEIIKQYAIKNKNNKTTYDVNIIDETPEYYITEKKAYSKESNEKVISNKHIVKDFPSVIFKNNYYYYSSYRLSKSTLIDIILIINNIESLIHTLYEDFNLNNY